MDIRKLYTGTSTELCRSIRTGVYLYRRDYVHFVHRLYTHLLKRGWTHEYLSTTIIEASRVIVIEKRGNNLHPPTTPPT